MEKERGLTEEKRMERRSLRENRGIGERKRKGKWSEDGGEYKDENKGSRGRA